MGISVNIEKRVAPKIFEKLGIDMKTSHLMNVKKVLWKRYGLPEPAELIYLPKKTLAEQEPNQSYGIPITPEERELLLRRFNITNPSPRSAAKEINQKILDDILFGKKI